MTGTVQPTRLLQVGIVKESSWGAGGTPALIVPVDYATPKDQVGLLTDASWRVAPASSFGHAVGSLDGQLQLGGPVFADSIGYPLAGILGDVAFAAGSPNTWTMALLNTGTQQPASHALTLDEPLGQLQWAGSMCSALAFAFDPDALLTWQGTWRGLASAASAHTMPALGSEKVIPGWVGVAKLNGTVTAQIASAQVKLARAVDVLRNVDGSQAPFLVRSGLLTVTGQIDLVLASDVYRGDWQAGTSLALDLSFANGAAGAASRTLTLHCSSVVLTSADRAYGKRWVEVSAAFVADANTTDVGGSGGRSPIKVTLTNQVGSGSY